MDTSAGLPEGNGSFTCPEFIYRGEWRAGEADGAGATTYADGQVTTHGITVCTVRSILVGLGQTFGQGLFVLFGPLMGTFLELLTTTFIAGACRCV